MKKLLVTSLVVLTGLLVYLGTQNGSPFSNGLERISVTKSTQSLANLDGQRKGLTKISQSDHKNRFHFQKKLMDVLSLQMMFLGDVSVLDEMAKFVDENSQDTNVIENNIKFFMTTHQFELAHKQIKKLSTKPGHKDRVKALMASLNMSRGENLAQAREDQLRVVGIRPNYSSYLQLAGIEQELGEYEAAQKYFDKSLEVYRNTSPFAPAYTYFHLGKMHAESIGDLHRGKIYYKEALHYVPEYVKARVHLAEIYMTEGRLDQALELLLKVKDSKDPEVPATIAEIYREQGDQEKAMPFLKKATKGYAVLLHKYELAFGDHGAEFFMGPGENPKKALELALLNLENRKSQRAFELAQEALNNAQKAQKSKNLKM